MVCSVFRKTHVMPTISMPNSPKRSQC